MKAQYMSTPGRAKKIIFVIWFISAVIAGLLSLEAVGVIMFGYL